MLKSTETGYLKNVANFDKLVSKVEALGINYQPGNESISLFNLKKQADMARFTVGQVHANLATLKDTIMARQEVFDPLKKFCTRIFSAARAFNITQKQTANLASLNKKIQGTRIGKIKVAPSKTPTDQVTTTTQDTTDTITERRISSSQQSYDSQVGNFDQMLQHLKVMSKYKPNEIELQINSLHALYTNLLEKNNQVLAAHTAVTTSRIERDKIMFDPVNGLNILAFNVKNYIKSIYGTNNIEYKGISKIQIRNT